MFFHEIETFFKFEILEKLFMVSNLTFLTKAELLQKGIFFLIRLFARDFLVTKKLEIEKTKPTDFILSVFKVDYLVVFVSSISIFFANKTSLANKWMSIAAVIWL